MALEMGAYNVRVNVVAPGMFESEITEGLFRKNLLKKVVKKVIPLRDLGKTNPAVTSLIRYLVHDSSKYVSGNVFIVDSGGTLPSFPLYSSL